MDLPCRDQHTEKLFSTPQYYPKMSEALQFPATPRWWSQKTTTIPALILAPTNKTRQFMRSNRRPKYKYKVPRFLSVVIRTDLILISWVRQLTLLRIPDENHQHSTVSRSNGEDVLPIGIREEWNCSRKGKREYKGNSSHSNSWYICR